MESTMSVVMKGVSDALRLDGNNNLQEAYIKYLECVLHVTTKLIRDTRKEGGQVLVTKEVIKFVRLGQQCMERISAIISQLGSQNVQTTARKSKTPDQNEPPNINQSSGSYQKGTRSAPCTPTDSSHVTTNTDSRTRLYSAPVPPLPGTESVYKRHKNMSPMEMAYKQNEQLMKAYKARVGRISARRMMATNLSLTIQRKMAENLAIAKAQEEALEKKMKERQIRLEEQAARKFNSPSGMSEEELEQKETYKKVLEYEQDTKWITELRTKLEENPQDATLINDLIQSILRCSDHPLTEKLKQYQYRIYAQLYPLVSTKMDRLKRIHVPLPEDLYPSTKSDSTKTDTKNTEQEKGDKSSSIAEEKEGVLKFDKSDKEQLPSVENKNEITFSGSEDLEDLQAKRDTNYESNWEISTGKCSDDNHPSISDVEEDECTGFQESDASVFSQGQGQDEQSTIKIESEKVDHSEISKGSEKDKVVKNIKHNGESESGSVLQEGEDSKDENFSDVIDDYDEKNLEDITKEIADDLELALNKGEQTRKTLQKETVKSQKLIHQISKGYGKYSDENMDSLLDEIMEEGDSSDDVESINQSDQDTEIVQSKQNEGTNEKEQSDIKDQSEKPETTSDSLSSKRLTSRPQVPKVLDLAGDVEKMRNEAYHRHLKGISSDIHNYLDKLISLFIVSYDQLDTPEGRDQLCASLEEPFFKPMWPYLLSLFRLSNEPREVSLAFVMTKQVHSIPGDFGVSEKLALPDLSTDSSYYPYRTAVHELQSIAQQYTLLSKLECLVKSFRLVCHCVEDYYQKDLESGKIDRIPSIGADDLVPILCYMIVKTKLPQLISECQIMEEFLHEGYIIGEEGYCLTSMQTALGYLLNLET